MADGLADRSPGGVDDCGREELGQASAIDPYLPLVHAFEGPVREPQRGCGLEQTVMGAA